MFIPLNVGSLQYTKIDFHENLDLHEDSSFADDVSFAGSMRNPFVMEHRGTSSTCSDDVAVCIHRCLSSVIISRFASWFR